MNLIAPLALLITLQVTTSLDNGLARTPPMGWMSWAAFYCQIDCKSHPDHCINEKLYQDMADRLVPTLLTFFQIDAETFASWEVDYLKLDGCNVNTTLMPIGEL
ncbi:hypothetical protein GCK32_009792 [Trichostrongylus colubriformis]|uniref:Alpha-galactosidase n=1 Tax=Trichostrongylus colubriformis TaxID=6319 RepID=A0AAN8FQA6_TRICO